MPRMCLFTDADTKAVVFINPAAVVAVRPGPTNVTVVELAYVNPVGVAETAEDDVKRLDRAMQ